MISYYYYLLLLICVFFRFGSWRHCFFESWIVTSRPYPFRTNLTFADDLIEILWRHWFWGFDLWRHNLSLIYRMALLSFLSWLKLWFWLCCRPPGIESLLELTPADRQQLASLANKQGTIHKMSACEFNENEVWLNVTIILFIILLFHHEREKCNFSAL